MPLYLFYPRDNAGVALMFEAHEFVDDVTALRKASEILAEHGSASTIEAWCDERRVASVSRNKERRRTDESGSATLLA